MTLCEALVSGLQDAAWTLGAVPAVLRHDNLSAAPHELRRSGGRQLTVRWRSPSWRTLISSSSRRRFSA